MAGFRVTDYVFDQHYPPSYVTMTTDSNPTVLPENIRKNLAKSTEHHTLMCLDCGYTGPMGVSRHINHWRWPLVVLAAVLGVFLIYFFLFAGKSKLMDDLTFLLFFSMPSWVYIVGGFVIMFTIRKVVPMFLCPNCEREISRV